MTKVSELPDRARAQREASEWIIRLNREQVSAEDRAAFEQWQKSSAVNTKAYQALSETWSRFSLAGRTVRAVAFGTSMQRVARKPRMAWPIVSTAAACLIFMFGVSMWATFDRRPSSYETGMGEQASVTLPDGSHLTLNSDSKVSIDYSSQARLIRLRRGEAFFVVAHETDRPFWVLADRTWVRAVGTAFNVHNRQGQVRVTVSEGVVKVGGLSKVGLPDKTPIVTSEGARLGQGQQVQIDGSVSTFSALAPSQLERELIWGNGTVYFKDRSLQEVLDDMSRYTHLELSVGKSAARTKVSGTFHTSQQGVEALLIMLEEGLSLNVVRDGKRRVHIDSHETIIGSES